MRFINQNKTKEFVLDEDNFWGFTPEELTEIGWEESDEPLCLSDKECQYCEGGGFFFTLTSDSSRLLTRCQHCDGTGMQLAK